MGNKLCCEENLKDEGAIYKLEQDLVHKKPHQDVSYPKQDKQEQEQQEPQAASNASSYYEDQIIPMVNEEDIQLPELLPKVKLTLDKHKFFEIERSIIAAKRRRYGGDIYSGQLDRENLSPNGLGVMYKQDGSLFLGQFSLGKAQGNGAYIFKDGSFYSGTFNNNIAQTPMGTGGRFDSETLKYTGGFLKNTFHGSGIQTGEDHHFVGNYNYGVKSDGKLIWKTSQGDSEYNGTFNSNNKFHGKGKLKDPLGVYDGDFDNGQKHGEGSYHYSNGSKYVGHYVHNQHEGMGTLSNADGSLLQYKGEFKKGLPHGKGFIPRGSTNIQVTMVEGIEESLIK